MKIFNPDQIRQIEEATFNHPFYPISYLELMEEAGSAAADAFIENFPSTDKVTIFCGTGNNGGDGLVIARLLSLAEIDVTVVLLEIGQPTIGHQQNLKKLPSHDKIERFTIQEGDDIDAIFDKIFKNPREQIIIDAILGIGLNRPLIGYWSKIVTKINQLVHFVLAIDIPSGLFANQPLNDNVAIQANFTFTFKAPKLSFFFPECEPYVGIWLELDIPLDDEAIDELPATHHIISFENIPFIPQRPTFSHKGTYGHALIIGGQYGMAGAALLSTKAALRSGCGKVTVLTPSCNQVVLQLGAPEALLLPTTSDRHLAAMSIFTGIYSAIGIGPGLGKHADTVQFLRKLFLANATFVVDADAINILAENHDILESLPKGSILTPHPKEFERIAGAWANSFERLDKQIAFSQKHGVYVIFKQANTCITTPEGQVYFNDTGNPGMAKGGTGDVLTGFLTGLLARGLSALDACIAAVFEHGLAGDFAAEAKSMESIKAGDLLDFLNQ